MIAFIKAVIAYLLGYRSGQAAAKAAATKETVTVYRRMAQAAGRVPSAPDELAQRLLDNGTF